VGRNIDPQHPALAQAVARGLRVQSEMNCRDHWAKVYDRKTKQFYVVRMALNLLPTATIKSLRADTKLPLRVTLTRLVGNRGKLMDTDNLASAFKFVRDSVAEWLHRDDGPKAGVEWITTQERADDWGVRVTIEAQGD
jgi:hypothetical protein